MSDKEPTLGSVFAEALAVKDFSRVAELVDPAVDFRGLTPNRAWQASDPDELVSEVLRQWFEESDVIEELLSVETATFADRERVTYSFRGHNDDGPFVVEQQAYLASENGRITWMRVLCSGFRPDPQG